MLCLIAFCLSELLAACRLPRKSHKLLFTSNLVLVDAYLHIAHMQLYYKSQTDLREYGSTAEEEAVVSLLSELRIMVREYEKALLDILIERLSSLTEDFFTFKGVKLL
ncbi:hypothetical protein H6P81_003976 [Aristolochia fimbriata]|uniref:Uncharacterized protein n=1 Tax=Aristolochia fimbriata TaxID=158543 RepID=A0AAV7FHM5_ARIFI|nr:hypothetical protein H6P81_003976 [Aristolochia fimbriata]